MQFEKMKIALIAGIVGATLAGGAQSLAQHQGHGGQMDHSKMDMSKPGGMQAGAKQIHDLMMQSAKKTMDIKMPMPSDTDRAFAAMMADHHASGIKMAQIEIRQGNDPKAKALAQKILAAQTKERAQLLNLAKTAR